jgi:quinol monooxygenase YgiN
MEAPLYLIASIYPKAEFIEFLKSEFSNLMKLSQQEAGCLIYDLVQGEGENHWVMMEKWSSRQAWDAHMHTNHVKAINSLDPKYFTKATELRFLNPI